jgi:DNA-binding MarR family transcriptional regulator
MASGSRSHLGSPDISPIGFRHSYMESVRLIEQLHRRYLDVVQNELKAQGVDDINNVQALMILHIGMTELAVTDLLKRGYYLASNVSYNVRKLAEAGYLTQERSTADRRSVRLRLTSKGLAQHERLAEMIERQVLALTEVTNFKELEAATRIFRHLGDFWHGQRHLGDISGF